jgi:hypothetical protein
MRGVITLQRLVRPYALGHDLRRRPAVVFGDNQKRASLLLPSAANLMLEVRS